MKLHEKVRKFPSIDFPKQEFFIFYKSKILGPLGVLLNNKPQSNFFPKNQAVTF